MIREIRLASERQRSRYRLRLLRQASDELRAETGDLDGMAAARTVVDMLAQTDDAALDGFFDHLAVDLSPDPQAVLRSAIAYKDNPGPATLKALTRVAESPRQELFRRLNRVPGGTAAVLRLRRALLQHLRDEPHLQVIEDDLQHLLGSWFNPGFLHMERVDWNSPAQLLEKIIRHEAVHSIDGWDDLRRRLRPDRRCFAFFHPQLPDEPLIFVEVALLPTMPAAIAPLIDKAAAPLPAKDFRVAAFYSISNCERGLRGVSLGNFLIKNVAQRLQRELPEIKTFCTLSPLPGFARWLLGAPDLNALSVPRRAPPLAQSLALLRARVGELATLQDPGVAAGLDADAAAALLRLAAAWLVQLAPTPAGDPVARFHLDNGARLDRLNPLANVTAEGLKQSFGLMVNYRYDLDEIEANHTSFRAGKVARSRAVAALLDR